MKESARLEQNKLFKGKRTFVLQDDGVLRITSSSAGQRQEFSVEVGQLDPEPFREKKSAGQMLGATLVFTGLAVAFAFPAFLPSTASDARPVHLGIAGFILIPALLCWREFVRQSYDVLVFHNAFSGAQFALFYNHPQPGIFLAFVEKLKAAIREWKTARFSSEKTIPEQIKELGKLHAEGLLTEEEFIQAKANLIQSIKAPGAIGFHQ